MVAKNFNVGAVIDYTCDEGHLLVGPSSRTCLPTGFYNEFPPVCKRKSNILLYSEVTPITKYFHACNVCNKKPDSQTQWKAKQLFSDFPPYFCISASCFTLFFPSIRFISPCNLHQDTVFNLKLPE